ncbi:hypothetical protein LCGC14_2837960 [marine sediment metagenome]|uniref:Uncharacterized protein n=1 Tax=marine sediment metagenome TaxID=412755 RepID=A0A0F9B370_9ZZZZ
MKYLSLISLPLSTILLTLTVQENNTFWAVFWTVITIINFIGVIKEIEEGR